MWDNEEGYHYRVTLFTNPAAVGFKNQFALIQLYKGGSPVEGAWDVSYMSAGVGTEREGDSVRKGWYSVDELQSHHLSGSYPKRDDGNNGGAPMFWSMELDDTIEMHAGNVTGSGASKGCFRLEAPAAANNVPARQVWSSPEDRARIAKQVEAQRSEFGKAYIFYSIIKRVGMKNGLVQVVDNDGSFGPEFLSKVSHRLMNPRENSLVAADFAQNGFPLKDFTTNGKYYANAGISGKVRDASIFKDGDYFPDPGSGKSTPQQIVNQNPNTPSGRARIVAVDPNNERERRGGGLFGFIGRSKRSGD